MATLLIPQPIRDIVTAPFRTRDAVSRVTSYKPGSAEAAIVGTWGGVYLTLSPAQRMIKAALRTTLAALGALILFKTGGSLAVAAVLGAIVSLPAVGIVTGGSLLYYGFTAARLALATGSFATLGMGLAYLAGGYLTLELHDILPFGLGEYAISSAAEEWARPVAQAFVS